MKILLALGANLPSVWGKPAETLSQAIVHLSERVGVTARSSRFFATPAYPLGSGPEFVNAVWALDADVSPRHLLDICHRIEADARRARDTRWGPRTLDIDVIACGDLILPNLEQHNFWRTLPLGEQIKSSPVDMIVPHPRLQDRPFVLVPMMDVAPDWRHPVLGLTTAQMLEQLPASEIRAVRPLQMP